MSERKRISELRGPRAEAPNDPSFRLAQGIRERFTNAPLSMGPYSTGAHWPKRLYHVGSIKAVAYTSDKWQTKDFWEDYKHLAEGHQDLYATDVALRAMPDLRRHLGGERVESEPLDARLPAVVAELAPIIFLQARLFHTYPKYASGKDEGFRQLAMPGSVMYAGYASPLSGSGRRKFFLTAIDRREGVHFIIVGPKLEVTKDGIVGLWPVDQYRECAATA
jgi:hypothetical protein